MAAKYIRSFFYLWLFGTKFQSGKTHSPLVNIINRSHVLAKYGVCSSGTSLKSPPAACLEWLPWQHTGCSKVCVDTGAT